MTIAESPSGLAFIALSCDRAGDVERVTRDDLGISCEAGKSLASYLDTDSRAKLDAFLREAAERGAAFDCEVLAEHGNTPIRLHLAAAVHDGSLLVIGTHSRNELADAVEAALPEGTLAEADRKLLLRRSAQDERILDHLSMLNSELVTAQRQLARVNADLAATLKLEEEMRRTLERTQDELQAALEFKDEVLGFAWHEVGSPLMIIRGAIGALLTHELNDTERDELLRDADDASRRLTNTLQSIFALSRVGLHAELALEEVALKPLIDHVVAEAQRGHPEHSIRVRMPDERISVTGDPELIDTVVRNLLTNAAKYSPAGAPIDVDVTRGDPITVAIADRGPGVHPEELDMIFRPFVRTTAGVASGAKGSGLGLAICRRLVEAQHGRIRAENRAGGGLVVSLTLPPSLE